MYLLVQLSKGLPVCPRHTCTPTLPSFPPPHSSQYPLSTVRGQEQLCTALLSGCVPPSRETVRGPRERVRAGWGGRAVAGRLGGQLCAIQLPTDGPSAATVTVPGSVLRVLQNRRESVIQGQMSDK